MKKCEEKIAKLPHLTNTKSSILAAEEVGFRHGWREALEWVLMWEDDERRCQIIEEELDFDS